ncbi:uncharacterized protein SCODWIG_02153 [Saccharomycodes ludwigii]|uniref:Something about silencing protein 4 domain-containing protein n=1 Tax=Saccharomycodes ludwigii TaxID=36035 RepID=A0A376B6W9_9ASCO|nr:hypothetical protein SCDLUD_001854 [Saccharomycodes ludwigii]KAH3902043.1 hypothetical protein SCDLUD_001854 [Saccharomycodes ludwigii]SSD60392.1 uncharacterized protein SCODWIG_02153 [Saccharomycodes ludwigii]
MTENDSLLHKKILTNDKEFTSKPKDNKTNATDTVNFSADSNNIQQNDKELCHLAHKDENNIQILVARKKRNGRGKGNYKKNAIKKELTKEISQDYTYLDTQMVKEHKIEPSNSSKKENNGNTSNDNNRDNNNPNEFFIFDYDSKELKPTTIIKILFISKNKIVPFPTDLINKIKTLENMKMTITHTYLKEKCNTKGIDPLYDERFHLFHNSLMKTEKKMLHKDKVNAQELVEKLQDILDTLNLEVWREYIPSITLMKDPNDEEELETKRTLTIKAIERLMEVSADVKKRTKILKIRQGYESFIRITKFINPEDTFIYNQFEDKDFIYGYSSSSDEEEDGLKTANEIRKHRRAKLATKFSKPTIVIDGQYFKIVAEPFNKPKRIVTFPIETQSRVYNPED